jgi:sensor histidine kinase YesM
MTGVSKDWLVVIAFFVGFFVFTAAETMWIHRRTDAGFQRSLFVAFGSNIFAVTFGYFLAFVIFVFLFMLVYIGVIPYLFEIYPTGKAYRVVTVLLATLFLILLHVSIKRLLLMTKPYRLEHPWLYSFLSAFLFNISVAIAPVLIAYFL